MDKLKKIKKPLVKIVYLFFFAALFILWLIALFHISNLWRGDSDSAFPVIAGRAVLHGNFLLHGYYLSSLVTYYPVDLYLNAAFIKIFGFGTVLIYIVPIFIFLALIVVAIIYVKERFNNKNDGPSLKIGIFMLFIFLALPVGAFAFFMLQELHGSTIVLSLITILLFSKFIKRKVGGYIYLFFGFVLLTITLINDNLALVIAVIPLLAALSVFYYADFKGRTAGETAGGIKKTSYLFAFLAVILAVASKKIIISIIRGSGGFRLAPIGLPIAFVRLKYLTKNIYFFFSALFRLFEANFFGKNLLSVFTFLSMAKFIIIGTVFIFLFYKIAARFLKKPTGEEGGRLNFNDFIDLTLLFGIIFLSAAFLLSNIALSKASARYLAPVIVYGLILAFRNIPAPVSKYYDRISFKIIGAVIIVVYTSSFIYAALTPIPKSPFRPLGKWLFKHNLTYGYGSYWDLGVITLMTKGKVKIRQVYAPYNKVTQYKWLSKTSWYKKKGFFVIYTKNFIYGNISKETIINTFGKPFQVYTEDFQGTIGKIYGGRAGKNSMPPYVIMVYKKGIRIDGRVYKRH